MRLYDKKDLNIRRKLERDQERKKPKRKKIGKGKVLSLKQKNQTYKKYASQIDKIAPQNIYTDNMCQSDKTQTHSPDPLKLLVYGGKQIEKIFNTV